MATDFIDTIKAKVLSGGSLSEEEAYRLGELTPEDEDRLTEAAAEVTERFGSRDFDSCSINARSGRCGEDCKWCAQSAHYKTGAGTYDLVGHDTCMKLAAYNRSRGIGRFSLVTSGRALGPSALETVCGYFRELREAGGMGLCASMGLLGTEALRKLREAGVERYHCNLESAPSHFSTLCTTHSIEDKIRTIEAAREAGLEICSGGIIGMGETRRQRIEFALTLRRVNPVSIPINILVPIPGTPLEGSGPLSGREILLTVAIFRMIHPRAVLRHDSQRDPARGPAHRDQREHHGRPADHHRLTDRRGHRDDTLLRLQFQHS